MATMLQTADALGSSFRKGHALRSVVVRVCFVLASPPFLGPLANPLCFCAHLTKAPCATHLHALPSPHSLAAG